MGTRHRRELLATLYSQLFTSPPRDLLFLVPLLLLSTVVIAYKLEPPVQVPALRSVAHAYMPGTAST
jgi:hypothetical protein